MVCFPGFVQLAGLACIASLLVVSPSLSQQVYTWTDERGRTLYSDQPPQTQDADEVELQVSEPTSEEQAAAQERLEDIRSAIEEMVKSREERQGDFADEETYLVRTVTITPGFHPNYRLRWHWWDRAVHLPRHARFPQQRSHKATPHRGQDPVEPARFSKR